jgi:RNA polymerase sigma-70 factor (ECF subfamily)
LDLIEKVRLAAAGNRDAFGDLVRKYERLVLGIAWNILRDYQAAQDVAQEAFLTAFRQLQGLKDPAAFGSWLAQITVRCCHQLRRARPLLALPVSHDLASAPPEALILSEETERVLTAIQTLPEQERQVVFLRFIEGCDAATISRLTGRPVGTVTKQLSRAVRRLRDLLVEVEQ